MQLLQKKTKLRILKMTDKEFINEFNKIIKNI